MFFPDHFRLHCYKPRTADACWIIFLRPVGSFDCALRLCELPATKLVLWKKDKTISERRKATESTNIHSVICISSSQNSRTKYFLSTQNADRVNNNMFNIWSVRFHHPHVAFLHWSGPGTLFLLFLNLIPSLPSWCWMWKWEIQAGTFHRTARASVPC